MVRRPRIQKLSDKDYTNHSRWAVRFLCLLEDLRCNLCLRSSLNSLMLKRHAVFVLLLLHFLEHPPLTEPYPSQLPAVTNCWGLHRTTSPPQVQERRTEAQPGCLLGNLPRDLSKEGGHEAVTTGHINWKQDIWLGKTRPPPLAKALIEQKFATSLLWSKSLDAKLSLRKLNKAAVLLRVKLSRSHIQLQ